MVSLKQFFWYKSSNAKRFFEIQGSVAIGALFSVRWELIDGIRASLERNIEIGNFVIRWVSIRWKSERIE